MSLDTLGAAQKKDAPEKVADFIAQDGYHYPVDTRTGTVVITPPEKGEFSVSDSRASAHENAITVDFISAGVRFHGGDHNSILTQRTEYAKYRYINADIGFTLER